jgi:hypothetical protein
MTFAVHVALMSWTNKDCNAKKHQPATWDRPQNFKTITVRHTRAMTAKQRYFWELVVVLSVFYPLYALCLHPRGDFAIIPCMIGSLGLLAFGVILIFRHRTFYGLIPFILALCLFFIALGLSGTKH